jgi:hypothetical protein
MHRPLRIIAVVAALAISGFFATGVAVADPYKWCAEYGGGDMGGGVNCGFVTIDQCRATISGIGGTCSPNPFYTGPENAPPVHKRKQRNN